MTRWHWVRHAPTHQKSFVGWRDVSADFSDQAQINRLAEALPKDAVVVSSDLTRSILTADAIAGTRHRLAHTPNLRELHFGAWDGLVFSEVSLSAPELSRAYWETPGDHAPPGGESWNQASHRVHCFVSHLNNKYAGREIIAVAHFGVILTQVQRAMKVQAHEVLAHKIDNLSLTQIMWENGEPTLESINQTY